MMLRNAVVLTPLAVLATAAPAFANSAPACSAVEVSTPHDVGKAIAITCTDPDNDALTITASAPSSGTVDTAHLSDPSPSVTYTPTAHHAGDDGFNVQAYDGHEYSQLARVTVHVTDQKPACTVDQQMVVHDHPKTFPISCSDADGDPVTLTATQPSPPPGTLDTSQLNGSAHTITFTPNTHYVGKVTIQLSAEDGVSGSAPASYSNASIAVTNAAPVCAGQSVPWPTGSGPVTVSVSCSDPDDDPLTLSARPGSNGSVDASGLNGPSHSFVWTPSDPYFTGSDGILIDATDGVQGGYTNATIGIVAQRPVSSGQTDPAVLVQLAASIKTAVHKAVDALAKSPAKVHGTSIDLGSVPAGTGCASCDVTAVLTAKGKTVGKAKEHFANAGLSHLTVKLDKAGRKLAAKRKLKVLATLTVTEKGPVPAIPDTVIDTMRTVTVKKLKRH